MRQSFEAGDHDGALAEADRLLAAVPDDAEALEIASRCRGTLEEVLFALLGGQRATFSVAANGQLLRALKQDERTAFLVRMIEEDFALGDLLEMCGPLKLEALRVLDELFRRGIIRRLW